MSASGEEGKPWAGGSALDKGVKPLRGGQRPGFTVPLSPFQGASPPPAAPTATGVPGSASRCSSSLFRADFPLGSPGRVPAGDSASISRRLRFLPASPLTAGEPLRAGVRGEPGSGGG